LDQRQQSSRIEAVTSGCVLNSQGGCAKREQRGRPSATVDLAEEDEATARPRDHVSKYANNRTSQIYATSEERKQRNRQAQAAFRERRTEYIKQLEETIRVHESNLHNLQTAHRTAADECLMLRYKNSLLERILLEKGEHRCLFCLDEPHRNTN
jgi:hypothetical protein